MNKLIIICLTLGIASLQANASLITNGSFEEFEAGTMPPAPGGFDAYPNGDGILGWTGVNSIEIHASGLLGVISQQGEFHIELNADPAQQDPFRVEQQFHTWEYELHKLSFWARKRDSGDGVFSVQVGDLDETISSHIVGEWTLFEFVFNSTASSQVLAFISGQAGNDTTGHFIDNIHISKVPVPGAIVLMLGGLLGLSAFRRKSTTAA